MTNTLHPLALIVYVARRLRSCCPGVQHGPCRWIFHPGSIVDKCTRGDDQAMWEGDKLVTMRTACFATSIAAAVSRTNVIPYLLRSAP